MSNQNDKGKQPETALEARANLAEAQRRDVMEKPEMIADPRKGLVFKDPGPPAGDGNRVQNTTDHPIGSFLPGKVTDVSSWPAKRLDRLYKSAAWRAEHLVHYKPGDKDPPEENPPFERLSRFKDKEALEKVATATKSDADKLRFWLAEDSRPDVAKAIEARLSAVK